MTDRTWQEPQNWDAVMPESLDLTSDDVHVWRASLDLEAPREEDLRRMLTSEECARADAFRLPVARRSYVLARAALRDILARYLGRDPRTIPLRLGPFGKPEVGDGSDDRHPLSFNVSHSHELSLFAITLKRRVGIDVERIRCIDRQMEIAERFFSRSEADALRALPVDARQEAFFACWTRKEAYLKACGSGLWALETTFDPEASGWSMRSLDPGPGYAAALAVEAQPCRITSWCWSRPAQAF